MRPWLHRPTVFAVLYSITHITEAYIIPSRSHRRSNLQVSTGSFENGHHRQVDDKIRSRKAALKEFCTSALISTGVSLGWSSAPEVAIAADSSGIGVTGTVQPIKIDSSLKAALQGTGSGSRESVQVYTTTSGLRYVELREGSGTRPSYGQLCTISYVASIQLPGASRPEKYDSAQSYLIKHGNGRIVAGLDEGIHSMAVGGRRRLIVPPKLGYVVGGLGPFPSNFWDLATFNRLLDGMVDSRGGQLVFDVELLAVIEDEADQGYYTDQSMSQEDFDTLRGNIQKTTAEALQAEKEKARQEAEDRQTGPII